MNEDRRAAIIWLLEHRNDHLPFATHNSTSPSGFVGGRDAKGRPIRTLSCPDCLANDRIMFGCETCGGSGQVADDGPDPYATNVVLPFGHDVTRHDESSERERQIARLDQQTRPPRSEAELLAEANQRGYAWEEQRRSLYRNYDLAPLDRSLDRLRSHDTDAAHALNMVYVDGWLAEVGQITPLIEVLCDRGIRFLSLVLPDPVRAGGDHKTPALLRRDRKHQREAA